MARKTEAKKRPKITDLPALVTVPQIAAQLGASSSFVLAHLEERGPGVKKTRLLVGDKELRVFRHGKGWCAWRAELADFVGEQVA